MRRGDRQLSDPPSGGGNSEPRPEQDNFGKPDPERTDELELIDAALSGDIDAFAQLFERYRQRLYALCLKRLSDHSLAEDAVQEVFVRAFVSIPNYQHRNLFWQWLATIAVRICIDFQRRRSFTHYSGDIGISVDEDAVSNGTSEKEGESALDAVIASEERAEVWESLGVLPKRQRRVFLLYAVDGWSCAEIATAEGISVGAVKLLLFRARRKMRSLRENGPQHALVLPFSWLRWKFQRVEERIRPLLGGYSEILPGACVQAVCLGALAIMTVVTTHPADSSNFSDADKGIVWSPQSSPLQTASAPTVLSNIGPSTKAPDDSHQSVADPASFLVDDVINPNQSSTPEDSYFYSITASPNYESDHTLLAVGHSSSAFVLFISHDGGGTWRPRPSRLLQGSSVVLPPNFPQDGRIFTSGGILGLQQSDDGGEIFRTVSPVSGGIAISPSFGRGDSKILIGGKTIFEYDAATGVTWPASPVLPPADQGYSSVAFSPSYQSDSTVFVAETWGGASYRCRGLLCDAMPLPTAEQLMFRFSPQCDQEGLAYVFTPWKLLVSHDQARTFERVEFAFEFRPPFYGSRSILNVAILCNRFSDPAIFASFIDESSFFPRLPSGIYRSFDAGRSWNRTSIDLPGFHAGVAASKLIVTPTGRLLATPWGGRGIACSEDGGVTWAPRCTPEP